MTRTSVYFSVSSVARNVSVKILVCGCVSYPPTGIYYLWFVQFKFPVYGHTQTYKHTYIRIYTRDSQCNHASVGLAQARPNNLPLTDKCMKLFTENITNISHMRKQFEPGLSSSGRGIGTAYMNIENLKIYCSLYLVTDMDLVYMICICKHFLCPCII